MGIQKQNVSHVVSRSLLYINDSKTWDSVLRIYKLKLLPFQRVHTFILYTNFFFSSIYFSCY